ncbi:MAG: hypothetical protein ACE15B_20785 [Bryobacteraceae bacterium]
MHPRGLSFLAALLTTGIIAAPFMGLDDLPQGVRTAIDSERASLAAVHRQFDQTRQEGGAALPPERVRAVEEALKPADADMAALDALYKANRRSDRARAEALLAHERQARSEAARETEKLAALAAIDRDYRAAMSVDLAPVAAAVEKAGRDWPEKRADLESRLASLSETQSGAEAAKARGDADALHRAALLPAQAAELQALAGQLYESWDQVLVDRDARRRREKIRTVRTRDGQVSSGERWVEVSRAEFHGSGDVGMAIAHKPAGRYDSEAERVSHPAWHAYVAPPAEGSNQYGRWERRGADTFWVWFGRYALLRELLSAASGGGATARPLDRREWESFRERHGAAPKQTPSFRSPTSSSTFSGSKYARGGGFSGSKYARGGSFGGSKYKSPSRAIPRVLGRRR